MDAQLIDSPFVDFGEDLLFPFARTGLSRIEGDTPEQLRNDVRRYVPRVPGVYGMLDALGRLIYVGKSKSLRNRLDLVNDRSYFYYHSCKRRYSLKLVDL